jgi:hypothetical protein
MAGATAHARRSRRRRWLLGAVLCGLAFGGPTFASDAPAPAGPGHAAAGPMTSMSAAQLKKLDDLLDDDGVDQLTPPVIATRLGLTKRVVKQLGVIDKMSGDMHAYARLPDGGMLLTFVDFSKTKLAYTYRLDAQFKVVASIVMDKVAPSAVATPEGGALTELSYWAQVADQL